MNIKPENSEIRTQHYMDAEGQSDLKPKEKEIEDYLNSRGFKSDGKISIDFDDFQSTWRWYTKIKELKMSTFKEYLEKTNLKEVVNENQDENGVQFKIELERLILKAIDSGVEDSKIGDIIKDSLEYYVDNQELSDEALFWK